jgi:hypothetical protein
MWQDAANVQRFLAPLFSSPLIRRVGWHVSRVRGAVDRRFFGQLLLGAGVLVGELGELLRELALVERRVRCMGAKRGLIEREHRPFA